MAKQAYTVRGEAVLDNQLFIATSTKRKAAIIDAIFYKDFILNWMIDRKDETLLGNSEQFECPITSEENPNGGMVGFDTGVSMDDFDPLNLAKYWPKLAVYNLVTSHRQKQSNRGSGKLIDLYQMKEDITVESMKRTFISQFWRGSGTGDEANGINLLIPATAKSSQTTEIGTITPSNAKYWWRSQATDMSGVAAASELEPTMSNMDRTIRDQGGRVDLWGGDQATVEIYERNQQEYILDIKVTIGDNNYTKIGFKGAPIEHSVDARAGELRAMDSRAITMAVDPMYWLEWTSQKEIPNVAIKTMAQYMAVFEFCRTSPRHTGCIFNINASGDN